jgi:hypothetical protein
MAIAALKHHIVYIILTLVKQLVLSATDLSNRYRQCLNDFIEDD